MILPDHPPTLDERMEIEEACRDDYALRVRVLERCKEDPAWFISAFGWTEDPRESAPIHDLPFVLRPHQIETVRWFHGLVTSQRDGLLDKSREMGVTWSMVGYVVWGYLFRSGFRALIGSKEERLVDDGTMDSHFGKIEYFLRNLPGWMLPRGFRMDVHRLKLRVFHPENDNQIIGRAPTGEFGRQGRYTVVFYDEAAFWDDLRKSWRAAGSTTKTRIAMSTPNGMNDFGRMIHMRDEDGNPVYPHLRLHWTLDPTKDQAWYERECARLVFPEDIAQELDISYQMSVKGVVYPTWHDVPKGSYPYRNGWSLYVSWDFGVADDTAIIWWARDPVSGKVRMVDAYSNSDKPIDFYVPFVTGEIPADNQWTYTYDEMQKIGLHATWPRPIHFGDPAGKQRNAVTNTSVFDVLAKYKIYVYTNSKANDFRSRKMSTELGLRQLEGVNLPDCAGVDEAMTNARFPESNPNTRSTVEKILPIHNWTSHFRTAVEYFYVNLPPLTRTTRPKTTRRKMAYDTIR